MNLHTARGAVAYGFEHGMFQHEAEIRPFAEWLEQLPLRGEPPLRRVLEIGMHRGGSARMWCQLADTLVIAVDLPDGPWGGQDFTASVARNQAIQADHPHFVGLLGDSRSPATVAAVQDVIEARPLGGLVDLLFIDADHSYLGVKHDYETYRPFVRPGGWVAFHDIADTPLHRDRGVMVCQLWRELVTSGLEARTWCINAEWGGIGAVRV